MPCLWGIIPGETSLETLKRLLDHFGDNHIPKEFDSAVHYYEGIGGLSIGFWSEDLRTSFLFGYRGDHEIQFLNLTAEAYYEKEEGANLTAMPAIGDPRFRRLNEYYSLSNVLKEYGNPDQVLLAPFPDTPDRNAAWGPFSLVMFYSQQGILIEYVVPRQQ